MMLLAIPFVIGLLSGLGYANEHTTNTIANSSCSQACAILSHEFPSRVFYPNSTNYTAEKTHYWDARQTLAPSCVFVPKDEHQVSTGVVVLKQVGSKFAVRGGGHMPVIGAANTDGGVLLALTAFKSIKVAADKKSVKAGPGLNWFQLNTALDPHGLVVIGGRLQTIGVPGLTLGGGIHYFTAKYGFAMDNVLSYTIVRSCGTITIASKAENKDLFWALKGGGSNFGIVTSFTFAVYKHPSISTAIQTFAETEVPAYCKAAADLANYQNGVDNLAGGIFNIAVVPSIGFVQPMFQGVQAGSVIKPKVFENFTAIPSLTATYNVTTMAVWTSRQDTPFQQARNQFGMHAVLADEKTLVGMYDAFKAGTEKMKAVTGFYANLVFQPIPVSAWKVAKNNGVGNVWGLDGEKSQIWWLITSTWQLGSDDKLVEGWARNLIEQIHAANLKAGTGREHLYLGDCAGWQKPYEVIPEDNLKRLKTIRAKYDQELVFRNLNSGGFKLD